jgi:hypothetical protein
MGTAKRQNIVLQNSLILGGYTLSGEILYIGRKIHMGVMTPGKIHPSHGCLYVSYNGYEYSYKHNYEILVSRGPSEWLSETKGKYSWYGVFIFSQKTKILVFKTQYNHYNFAA